MSEAPAEDAKGPIETSDVLSFPVVGIGASAGGLEAFTQLLHALPADTGMAFVLVQHLAPTRASMLSEILARATAMPVLEVHDEPAVTANHVYVIPPGQDMPCRSATNRTFVHFGVSIKTGQAHRIREALPVGVAARARDEGRAMSREEAIQYALSSLTAMGAAQ